jgi:hypothetical protein
MPKTNLDILEDLLYKVGKMSEDDVGVVEFEVFSELLERLKNPVRVNIWLNGEYRG